MFSLNLGVEVSKTQFERKMFDKRDILESRLSNEYDHCFNKAEKRII